LPARIIDTIIEAEISELPLVPPLVYALAESDWPARKAPRLVISAGGPLAPEIADRFLARTGSPVHQFYGATECGGICFERCPTAPEALATVGAPLPGVRVELGEGGIVQVHSPANYCARFGESVVAERKIVEPGDTAEWTVEGRLRLTGRSADILNIGGRKVAAVVIERALLELDGVEQAAVVGVEDAVRGDRVVAFVVAGSSPDLSSLAAGLIPREVRRVDHLPFTTRGKLDRERLRAWASTRSESKGA
ncbi:MAG TPA: AMP-binding protein, partial [Thermoanaerobaculia bacterium]|nr:AMP-binding protein [Thermoanaerobaculia bacterium]